MGLYMMVGLMAGLAVIALQSPSVALAQAPSGEVDAQLGVPVGVALEWSPELAEARELIARDDALCSEQGVVPRACVSVPEDEAIPVLLVQAAWIEA